MPGLKGRPLAIGAAAVLVIVIGYLALSQVSNLHLNLGPNFSSGASAADLLNSGIDSLSSGHSYHLAVTGSGGSLDVSVQELGLAQVTLKDSTGDVSMIVSDGREYLKAPASFYNPRNPIIGQHAANQWVMLAQAETLQVFDDVTNLAGIAQCTLGRHGSLTYAGSTSVDGESVQEVDDRGDGPSGARARFYFGSDKRVVAMDLTEPVLPSPSPPADSQSSSGSSSALQCAGGTGVYDTGFRGNQHYHFDRWGGTFDIAAPKGAIDLESAPWCGTMAARELSTAAQQFLAAQYDLDQKLKTITQEPGCCDPHNWSQFSQALKDEATARDAEGQAISKLPGLDGQTKSDADALAQAIAATVKQLKQSASGTAGTWQSTGANQRSDLGTVESGDVDALRQDLNLPSGTCSFAVP